MRIEARPWAGAAGVLAVFAIAAWLLPGLLGVTGTLAWILRAGLLVFGLLAAILALLYLGARARRRRATEIDGGEDIDQLIAAAEARLEASDQTTESRLGRLPVGLVLGPTGSTKSSILRHSGLDPELLAGEVERGDAVVPTDPINVWYAHGTVLVEAGGRLLEDEARWRRLVRRLLPSRLAAALGRGRQAPRFAILCIACDEFLKPGSTQSLAVTARQLRTRVGEVSQQLGVKLPVYVLLTRADRVPFFTDYVRSFTSDEAEQVLGVTLPLRADSGGTWAELESPRLNDAFSRIVQALASRRLDVLGREVDTELRGQAYEFPRELRKIVEPAVQFLLDAFRPSQLGVNPFVRGVYFTGVRPVIPRDAGVEQRTAPVQPSAADAGATIIFDPAMLRQATARQAAVTEARGRRVPQWVFLRRFFRDVVLRDDAAERLTGSGARVELLRRGLIATAAAACVVLALGFTVSYAGNRRMVGDAITATREALEAGNIPGQRSEEDLEKLDTLRTLTETLSRYERSGRPLRLAWGLYTGETLQPVLQRTYFDRFAVMLWDDTRGRLTQVLRELPEQPDENSDFGRAQDALAAHLLTTSEYRRSTPELLAPALTSFWSAADASDRMRGLALRQFQFFASELPNGNPYGGTTVDAALVERSQRFLRAFGADAYYRALIADASSAAPAARYTRADIVSNEVEVPGAFTRDGSWIMQANLDSVDQVFARYEWIYGDRPVADKPQRSELAAMYEAEFIDRWQQYLARARVEPFADVGQAAGRMPVLSAPSSPLFAMLATASRETRSDTTTHIGRAFQPLHATVAPEAEPVALTAAVTGYTNALNALGSHLNLLAGASGPARDQAAGQALGGVSEVRAQAAAIAAAFTLTGDAAVTGSNIQRLLREPANHAENVIRGLDTADLNAAGASFCSTFNPLARSFPFAVGGADALVDDVNAIFERDGGTLWALYEQSLQPLLTEQGRPKPSARVRTEFARFFNAASDFSDALYRTGALAIAFDFQPEIPASATEVRLIAGGSPISFTPTARRGRSFEWSPDRHREAQLVVVFGDEPVVVAEAAGPWAIFKLFYAANWTGDTSPYGVAWRVPGRSTAVTATVSFETNTPPVLRPGYLNRLARCVNRVR